jgi:hypothetical protein
VENIETTYSGFLGKAGVAIREGLGWGDKMVTLSTDLAYWVYRRARQYAFAPAYSYSVYRPQHMWLKIERTGNAIWCYSRFDESLPWQSVYGYWVAMDECVYRNNRYIQQCPDLLQLRSTNGH